LAPTVLHALLYYTVCIQFLLISEQHFIEKKTSVRFVSIGISVYNYNKKVNMSIVFTSVLTYHFEYYLDFYIKKNIDTIHFDNFLYLIAASFFVNKITSGNIVRNINKDNCKTKNSNNNLC
jgi:hypothetical protein